MKRKLTALILSVLMAFSAASVLAENASLSGLMEEMSSDVYFMPSSEALVGSVLTFETVSTDGAPIKSEELFAAHALTMVNVWATWCGPCLYEMPDLGDIARRLEADGKDAALVGICLDAAESLDQCKQLLAETKVDYLNLLPYQNMMTDLGIEAIPSSLFVDREGKILLPMVVGVPRDVSAYEKLIDGLLAAVSPAEEATAEEAQASDAAQDAYRVKVVDENGTPLPGAMVQFCGTTFCSVLFTDENGVAAFQGVEERQPYTVHLLKAPEGYEGTDEEFTAPATYGDITIVLKKAS